MAKASAFFAANESSSDGIETPPPPFLLARCRSLLKRIIGSVISSNKGVWGGPGG